MSSREILEEITQGIVNFDEETVENGVKKAIAAKIDPIEAIQEGLAKGIREVGQRYEAQEYFLPELVMAANLMKKGVQMLKPLIGENLHRELNRRRVLMGTVKGDIHDIGKNIVSAMLEANGFEVIDIGVDIPAEDFVQKIKEYKPDIVGMSALLTTTISEMKTVIEALREAGLRDSVKIMIGGAPTTEEFAEEIGADAHGVDAIDAVRKAKSFL